MTMLYMSWGFVIRNFGLHIRNADRAKKKSKLLLIGGHEGIGRLVAIGVNLESVGVGDRVAFKWFVTCVDSVSFFQLWIFVLCPIYISGVKCVAKDTSRVCLLTYFPMFFKLSLMHIFIMDK